MGPLNMPSNVLIASVDGVLVKQSAFCFADAQKRIALSFVAASFTTHHLKAIHLVLGRNSSAFATSMAEVLSSHINVGFGKPPTVASLSRYFHIWKSRRPQFLAQPIPSAADIYSDMHDDVALTLCRLLRQPTGVPYANIVAPETEYCSSTAEAQLASVNNENSVILVSFPCPSHLYAVR